VALTIEIELDDETSSAAPHLPLLHELAKRALESEGLDGAYHVTISIVDDERIRELNSAHRGIDKVTDVLSFPLLDEDAAAFVLPPDTPTYLGDVVIAIDQARRQAEEYGHSFERELAYLTAHGLLHLLGYDHEDDEEKVQMRAREEEILLDLQR
jgi:probable rRNA maturation factor